ARPTQHHPIPTQLLKTQNQHFLSTKPKPEIVLQYHKNPKIRHIILPLTLTLDLRGVPNGGKFGVKLHYVNRARPFSPPFGTQFEQHLTQQC
ncbi:hypothetical protein, partial [Mobiluncus mulieris]|uniref:hypothetical protein n=1 Tax=Mobiluncus mulieris TaxID=2052 RepID=UPI0021E25A28